MNTKLITLVMAAIATVVSGVTAYATYSEPPAWIGGPGAVVVEDEIPIESEPLEPDNSAVSSVDVNSSEEGSEAPQIAVPDGSMLLTTGDGSNPVVDVSPESITAIADAVAPASTIVCSDGITRKVPDIILAEWDNFPYRLLYRVNGSNCWVLANGKSEGAVSYSSGWYQEMYEACRTYMSDSSWHTRPDQLDADIEIEVNKIVWANFDIRDASGNLIRPGEAQPDPISYDVNFVSGFPDLDIPSQSSLTLDLPSPKYDGYSFMGWYLDSDFTTVFTGGEITSDITLYAKWEKLGPMAMFWQVIFASLIALLNCEPIFYLLTLICLCMILAVIRLFINSR